MKKLEEVELINNDEDDGITAMSFVEFPAIEKQMVYFGENRTNFSFGKEVEEQGIIVSPALIADKRIYRYDPISNEEYYVYFSEQTIRQLSQKFLMSNNFQNNTEQHEEQVEGISLIYSWIVENQDDQLMSKYGFKDVPNGSWAVAYKIDNQAIRDKIKSGEISGLSIEAFLTEKYDKHNTPEQTQYEQIKEILSNLG
jgi:hypothetical protein